jgi:hypothetical protein
MHSQWRQCTGSDPRTEVRQQRGPLGGGAHLFALPTSLPTCPRPHTRAAAAGTGIPRRRKLIAYRGGGSSLHTEEEKAHGIPRTLIMAYRGGSSFPFVFLLVGKRQPACASVSGGAHIAPERLLSLFSLSLFPLSSATSPVFSCCIAVSLAHNGACAAGRGGGRGLWPREQGARHPDRCARACAHPATATPGGSCCAAAANFPEAVVDNLPSSMTQGIYFGWAQVRCIAGAEQCALEGVLASAHMPAVLSVRWAADRYTRPS